MRTIGALSSIFDPNAVAEDAKSNDAQIAYTADPIDIKGDKLALQKSKNKEVRDFAENMFAIARRSTTRLWR